MRCSGSRSRSSFVGLPPMRRPPVEVGGLSMSRARFRAVATSLRLSPPVALARRHHQPLGAVGVVRPESPRRGRPSAVSRHRGGLLGSRAEAQGGSRSELENRSKTTPGIMLTTSGAVGDEQPGARHDGDHGERRDPPVTATPDAGQARPLLGGGLVHLPLSFSVDLRGEFVEALIDVFYVRHWGVLRWKQMLRS